MAHRLQFIEFLFLDFCALDQGCDAIVGCLRLSLVVEGLLACLAVFKHSFTVLFPMVLDQCLHCTKFCSAVITATRCIAEVLAERRTVLRKMLLMISIRENTSTLITLEVCPIKALLHVGVELLRLPRLVTLTALPRASRHAKGSLAARLTEEVLALTAADRLSDHVAANLALEVRV